MRRALLVLFSIVAGCHRGQDAPAGVDAMAAAAPLEAGMLAQPAVVQARCHPAGSGARGGASIADPVDLELGDAVAFGDGIAVALVHRTAAGRVGAVALVDRDVTSAHVVDVGPTLGDAPPPRIAVRGQELVVASYALARTGDARELAVQRIGPGGDVKPLASIPQQRDDSLAFDLGSGLVAWDEAAASSGVPRGVVRVAELGVDHAGGARDLSPPESDAEMPRIVSDGAGYFVLWTARRPESVIPPDAAPSAAEAVGEARAYSWVEAVHVDAAGMPGGPARRLTPVTGHVSAFDVGTRTLAGPGKPSLLLVARDDGEAVDGSGGALLRIRLREDGAEPALAFPGDGLGRGAPSLVEGALLPWLTWIGPHEELRLLPLDAAGVPVAPPSAEPLLDDALPLVVLAPAGAEDRILVGFPGEGSAGDASVQAPELRVFACSR